MKRYLFFVLPLFFLSSLIFAQSELDKKIISAGNYFNNDDYEMVIETLKNESKTDYRVNYFSTAARYEILKLNNFADPEEIYAVKREVKNYLLNFESKRENFTQRIADYNAYLEHNYPPTLAEYYTQKAQREAEAKEREKQERINELNSQYNLGNYTNVLNLVNKYNNQDIELYHLKFYEAASKFWIFKNREIYDYNDLLDVKSLLESYILNYSEKDSYYKSVIETDLVNLNTDYPKTQEEYQQKMEEIRNRQKKEEYNRNLAELRSDYNSGLYHSVNSSAYKFHDAQTNEEVQYYIVKARYQIFLGNTNKNFTDFQSLRNDLERFINNPNFNHRSWKNEIKNNLKLINDTYPKTLSEWTKNEKKERIRKEKELEKEKKIKEKENKQTLRKLNRKYSDSFIAIGYEGGTIAKYGLRFEVGGRTLGFFFNARTTLVNDNDIKSQIYYFPENKNEAIVGISLKISSWLFLNLGSGYGFYKEPSEKEGGLEIIEYFPGYGGLTIRLGKRFNLIGGVSYMDFKPYDWYEHPEYTFGLTINLR